jgi:hypothetical protein
MLLAERSKLLSTKKPSSISFLFLDGYSPGGTTGESIKVRVKVLSSSHYFICKTVFHFNTLSDRDKLPSTKKAVLVDGLYSN